MSKEQDIKDILEIVSFIKDKSVTKDEFNNELGGVKSEITGIKSDITGIKSTMVTKDYLDDKLADLRGDLTILMRKEDTKLKTLVDILFKKGHLSDEEKEKIFSLEPFPQLSL